LGCPVRRYRVTALVLSAFLAGLGGGVFATGLGFISCTPCTGDSGDGWGTGLSITGAVLGVVALVIPLLAYRKSVTRLPYR
jgi:ABC-type uncharacterized transport system permease subunit